jgi:hypothetical protein
MAISLATQFWAPRRPEVARCAAPSARSSTRLAVDQSMRCLLEPSDALPLLEIVPGWYQYAARFLTEHPQMHHVAFHQKPGC